MTGAGGGPTHDAAPPRRVPPVVGAGSEPDTASPVPGRSLPDGWGSYEHFRQLFEQAPVAMSLIDLATRTHIPNPAYLTLFGYEDGADGVDALALVHPDLREQTSLQYRALLRGEIDRIDADKRYLRADGTVLDAHVDASLLRQADGSPWAVLVVMSDLTARKAAEAARAGSEARLEALVANAADAIVVLDREAALTYASPAASRLVGSPAEERLGTSALDLVHPDDLDVVARSFLNTAATPGVAVPLRFRLAHADGSFRVVEAVATNLLDDPAVGGVVVNLRDLTDHQRAQSALELAEARWRSMLENISDTVTLIDASASVVATTGNLKEILGYPTDFWDVRSGFDIVHPDDVPLVRQLFERLLAEPPGTELSGEFRARTSTGEVVEVEGTAVNLLDDPHVAAIVLTTRNITARKQIERELAEARDRAVSALALRNEFIASVSHELRTPVHGIAGLAELLATADLDESTRTLAQSIGRATASLELVLDDLLDFSKLEAGRLELSHEPVDVGALVEELVTLYGAQASGKGVALSARVSPDVPPVLTDGFRLRQVLANLVSNAVKFTPVGEVTVAVDRDRVDGTDRLRLEVADTGIGIEAAALAHLFEPFSQAYTSTSREFGGTGLGLTIARRLSELLGGELSIATELGAGSTFTVLLPLVSAGPASWEAATTRIPTSDGGGRRVLVAEDNPVNQLLVRHQLERLGYEPAVVGSGLEALEQFRAAPVAAVLLDCQMPGLDGLETARRLRDIEGRLGRGRAPVVALTANALPGERGRCLEAGMDDFLAKPVGLADLGDALDRWLGPLPADEAPGDGAAPPHGADPSSPAGADDRREVLGTLDELVEELEDAGVVTGVVTAFRRELPARLARLRAAAAADDVDEVGAAAHVLAGAAAVVGGRELADRCRALEVDPGGAESRAADVALAAEALDGLLGRWLDEHGGG